MSCSQKRLESDLQQLGVFEAPKLPLEQYNTPPGFAAEMLHVIQEDTGLVGKTVLDLGCGCGILGLGCVRVGASRVIGIDIDTEALKIAEKNKDEVGLTDQDILFQQGDVRKLQLEDLPVGLRTFDLVVSNPPFGVWGEGENRDVIFVKKGLEFADVVYTVHKSTARSFLLQSVREMKGVKLEFIFQDKVFSIPQTFKFHKFKERSILVDVAKFTNV